MLKYSKNLKWNDDARHARLNSFFSDKSMHSLGCSDYALYIIPLSIEYYLFLAFTMRPNSVILLLVQNANQSIFTYIILINNMIGMLMLGIRYKPYMALFDFFGANNARI